MSAAMAKRIVSLALFSLLLAQLFLEVIGERWQFPPGRWSGIDRKNGLLRNSSLKIKKDPLLLQTRCGDEQDDEERYSRQVYTLGARAHGLIRSATVYIDGPAKSGLVYECAKNLALSGIGKIVILSSSEEHDAAYHSAELDDLGITYMKGARAEIEKDGKDCDSDEELLREYLHRLNPSLNLQVMPRDELNRNDIGNGILLCIDRPFDTKRRLNRLCRRHGFPFVAAETAGVYGLAFSDFGPSFQVHDVDGETPLVVPLDRVEAIDGEDTILVRCVSGERHDVSRGDEIKFQLSTGEKLDIPCAVDKVKSPELVSVRLLSDGISMDDFVAKVNSEASTFTRLKKVVEVSFSPLEEAVANAKEDPSLFVPSDLDKSFDDVRRNAIFSSFQGLNAFVKGTGRLPTAEDSDEFLSTAKNSWAVAGSSENAAWNGHCALFSRTCRAKFVPQQAIFGAIASQECLKAASGLYNPLRQFLLYDCDEVLPTNLVDNKAVAAASSGLSYIFGEKITQEFQGKKIFVVGAGAIGCELLKNLAAMGAATCENGMVLVTDMDTIEHSNLSRQLLFRHDDIGKFKSQAAEEAVGRLNPLLKLECHVSRVGDDEHGPFDFRFWSENVDVVLNALDNVEARLFIDSRCVANRLGLVDAGTLGSKGNVQVVVPHETESYGSSVDPPEPSIAVCTLKNFPYAISHTIQWGRDLFEGIFARRPKKNTDYFESLAGAGVQNLVTKLESDLGEQEALDAARALKEDLDTIQSKRDGNLRSQCISWAIGLAEDLFHGKIVELLAKHPIDSLDEDNEPFWSGSRKAPTPATFSADDQLDSQQDIVNRNYIDFVRSAARLRMETFLVYAEESGASYISADEAEIALRRAKENKPISLGDRADSIRGLLSEIPSPADDDTILHAAEFEKDDESNGHVAFITAASNLRAICYGIPPVDAMETRKVAGNIVPAMVTTTAFVSALSCIELFKLVQKSTLRNYRNSFINLALPFFASTFPLPAETVEGLRGQTYTLWDQIVVKESKKAAAAGGISLRRLLKRLKREISDEAEEVAISSISFGPYLIYANFLHEDEDEHLSRNIWDLISNAVDSGDEFDNEYSRESKKESGARKFQNQQVVELSVIAEDMETGEEVELPPVRVFRRPESQSSSQSKKTSSVTNL
jgi:ubiquitin-activating enzyme E1